MKRIAVITLSMALLAASDVILELQNPLKGTNK